MNRLMMMAFVVCVASGCAGSRSIYAGPVRLRSDVPSGLVLDGPNGRPVECQSESRDSFIDIKNGQWIVVEGLKSHDKEIAIRLRDCRVFAVATGEFVDGSGLELRRREPLSPPSEKREGTPPSGSRTAAR